MLYDKGIKMRYVKPLQNLDNEIFDAKGRLLAKCWRKDIADFLVLEINSHDALLEACKAAIKQVRERDLTNKCVSGLGLQLNKAIAQAKE